MALIEQDPLITSYNINVILNLCLVDRWAQLTVGLSHSEKGCLFIFIDKEMGSTHKRLRGDPFLSSIIC